MIQKSRSLMEYESARYLRNRTQIEEEIRQRQESWRSLICDETEEGESVKEAHIRPVRPNVELEEPPPDHS